MFKKIGIGLIAVALIGCNKFLEVEPKESISDELAITDKTSLNTAVRGLYRTLADNGYYGEGYVNLGFVPSGEITYNVFNNVSNLNFRPDDAAFVDTWAAIYATINIANHIIQKAPQVQDVNLTDIERNTIVGEAHFVRALAYFDLARGWGGVPLKLEPTTSLVSNEQIARSSREEVYAFVRQELDLAESLLPEEVNRVRATKYTVWALRARLDLYTKNWDEAIDYATKVIGLTDAYKLVKPFSAWFSNGAVQTPESIFELAHSAQNPSGLRTRMSLLSNGGEYRYAPSEPVVKTLQHPATGGDRVALLDSATQSGVKLYAGALYYRSPATDPSYVLRIAEQYLIRAEAKAEIDDAAGALSDLNQVRERAGLQALTTQSIDVLKDAVLEERRLEFLWEAQRYFDLARTGKLKEKIEALKPNLTITEHLNLFPIPIDEVNLGGLKQNPGYE